MDSTIARQYRIISIVTGFDFYHFLTFYVKCCICCISKYTRSQSAFLIHEWVWEYWSLNVICVRKLLCSTWSLSYKNPVTKKYFMMNFGPVMSIPQYFELNVLFFFCLRTFMCRKAIWFSWNQIDVGMNMLLIKVNQVLVLTRFSHYQ